MSDLKKYIVVCAIVYFIMCMISLVVCVIMGVAFSLLDILGLGLVEYTIFYMIMILVFYVLWH